MSPWRRLTAITCVPLATIAAIAGPVDARVVEKSADGGVIVTDPPVRPPRSALVESLRIGSTSRGIPIVAERYGTPGGTVVLVVAGIHGNEVAGRQITRAIVDGARRGRTPAGIDLWVIHSANPDGIAAGTRQNGRGVDLNRNFPVRWRPLACPGKYCSGPAAGSEPETKAIMAFLLRARPEVAIWWHSTGRIVDASPSGVAEPAVLHAYARATGYPVGEVACGPDSVCSGTATQFGNARIRGATHFVVELPVDSPSLSPSDVGRHVRAVWAAARASR